ncbi:glycosyltransferase family 4 protein [Macrococcus sp. DPC7161]|uniref:glycosyltransferase family 4 protein n=1 Tax=Macrococcus sp. DPC7161 TaxID=2507060 RepID=UPI00100B57D1|nr:glycosyltransferase family 4 protein [Macrococcus sp. DPC7161]RXK17231.1 glycosyltransferase WbuB [Macrococcus sp. DPC7161]
MKVLFLTLLNLEDLTKNGIYHDFVNELSSRGHDVSVVCPSEKRFGGETKLIETNSIDVLKVLIGDITQTSYIKKGINTLLIESKYEKAINTYFKDKKFDLIIYTTPPITFNNLVLKLKKKNNAKTYLLLKDIFPQNAVDLGIFSKNSPIYKLFRFKEKQLYKISDYVGGMSVGNIDFIKSHNEIHSKTQVIRNALYELDYRIDDSIDKTSLFNKYDIDSNKKIFLYGGNIGAPQGIPFIKSVMSRFNEVEDGFLLIVGSGTHSNELIKHAKYLNYSNVKVMSKLPKEEYDQLVMLSDIGLIFLDHRFTIPNYPSRLTSLLNAKKPILMATDVNTDIKDDIIKHKCGLWSESTDVDLFIKNAVRMTNEDLSQYGENSYKLYLDEFKIENNIDKLLKLINE